MRIVSAHELGDKLHIIVDGGMGTTYALDLPADSDPEAIRAACLTRIQEEEDRERRKVLREDLLGDL
jgi:hypothetical protein